jgi:hypothetical protein
MNLPPQKDEAGEDTNMSPEVEARLSPLLAQAAQQLLQSNQQEAQQQQAQQQAQDPMVQMQQAELQIKQGELERKKQKDLMDAQLKQQQLQIDRERIENQTQIEGVRIGLKAEQEKRNQDDKQQYEGIKIGTDTSATIPTVITTLYPGSNQSGSANINGHIKNIKYYKEVLSENRCISLTTL